MSLFAIPVCADCGNPLIHNGIYGYCVRCNNQLMNRRPIIVVKPQINITVSPSGFSPQQNTGTYRKCFCCSSGAQNIFTDRYGTDHYVCGKTFCNTELRRRY